MSENPPPTRTGTPETPQGCPSPFTPPDREGSHGDKVGKIS